MLHSSRRFRAAIVLASVLAIASAGSVAAASSQTVVVLGTISVTGVPASVDFGTGGPGEVKGIAPYKVVVLTNNPTGYILRASSGKLINGANEIPKANQFWDGAPGAGCNASCSDPAGAYMTGAAVDLGTRSEQSTALGDTWAVTSTLTIPNVPPGTYVGNDGNGTRLYRLWRVAVVA